MLAVVTKLVTQSHSIPLYAVLIGPGLTAAMAQTGEKKESGQ